MTFKPFLLTTGVGSLPHQDVNEALKLVWRYVSKAPHWPQLPSLGAANSFVGQYLQVLLDTGVISGYERPMFQIEADDWTERLTSFYEVYLKAESGDAEALECFGFGAEGGLGFVEFCRDIEEHGTREAVLLKGQLSGPLTLGLQITDKNRRASYYDDTLRDILVKTLSLHAEWQTKRLRKYGLPVLMMIDDPGFYAYGASTHVTLARARLIADLNIIAEGIMRQGGIPGVHVCAGMDWTLLFDSEVQVVNFDAYEYMTSMMVLAEPLNRFLARGGVLSWGIVPTQAGIWPESDVLVQRLKNNMAELVKRGVDESLLCSQSIITPSCGTGTLAVEVAEQIYKLLGEMGRYLEKELPECRA